MRVEVEGASRGEDVHLLPFIVNEESSREGHGNVTYGMNIGDLTFGTLIIKHKVKVLGWKGNIDFSDLETELNVSLGDSLEGDEGNNSPSRNGLVSFSFVDGSSKSHRRKRHQLEFSLKDKNDKHYRNILSAPENIVSAVYNLSRGGIDYVVTAENPTYVEYHKKPNNLRLKIPINYEITPELLNWVAYHHELANEIKGKFDTELASKILSSLIV